MKFRTLVTLFSEKNGWIYSDDVMWLLSTRPKGE